MTICGSTGYYVLDYFLAERSDFSESPFSGIYLSIFVLFINLL